MRRSVLVAVIAAALSCTLLVSLVSASPSPPNPVPPPAGYTMPAEWDPHVATWLSWGHRWQEETTRDLQVQIIDILQEGEEVHVLVDTAQQEAAVKRMMRMAGVPPDNVFIHIIPADDIWIRDFGPTWIDDGTTQAIVDWLFDGWGEQSLSWDDNDEVPREIADLLGQDFYSYMDYVVEGGAIDVNGLGTLMTSESLLNPIIRDPVPTKEELEDAFTAYLGVTNFIWLEGYLTGDTWTYGHIDGLAKFVNENTIVCNWQPDPEGPDYDVCVNNYEILVNSVDQDGNPFNIVKVPVAQNLIYAYGLPILPEYINFYIGNEVVLVPIYGDPRDAEALSIYESLFPTRTVVGLDCSLLITFGGEIHCITQQQPAVP